MPSVATDDRKQFQYNQIVLNNKTRSLVLKFNWCEDTYWLFIKLPNIVTMPLFNNASAKKEREIGTGMQKANCNWTISRFVKSNFRRIFQPIVVHVIYEPVIVNRTNNRDFECTKNCILMWNFPYMRFHWNFTILIIIVQYLVCVKFKFAILQ